jgi:hypothetical protein
MQDFLLICQFLQLDFVECRRISHSFFSQQPNLVLKNQYILEHAALVSLPL